jgi:hypothetical protein
VICLVVLPLLSLSTTFVPFLSALVVRTVSVTFFLPLLLTEAVLWPCRRIVPLNFAVELDDTAQLIDLRLEASFHAAANVSAAVFVVVTGAPAGAGAAMAAGAGPGAGAET